jgi:hypothetical protein
VFAANEELGRGLSGSRRLKEGIQISEGEVVAVYGWVRAAREAKLYRPSRDCGPKMMAFSANSD